MVQPQLLAQKVLPQLANVLEEVETLSNLSVPVFVVLVGSQRIINLMLTQLRTVKNSPIPLVLLIKMLMLTEIV